MKQGYDTAQICTNGHVINSSAINSPQFSKPHCTDCGAKTITQCEACATPIQGHYHSPGVLSFSPDEAPRYCHACGKPYPWIVKGLKAANDLADDMQSLSPAEKAQFKESFDALVQGGPGTELAAQKIKRLLKKEGEAAARIFREIGVSVLGEVAKRAMGL